MAVQRPRLKRWTSKAYYRLAEKGLFRAPRFGRHRVELIEGLIFHLPPQTESQCVARALTDQALRVVFGEGFWIRQLFPLNLPRHTVPDPDIAVVSGRPRDYAEHPTSALLIVEIGDTAVEYFRERKNGLYARAGIPEFWILNLRNRQLEVHRAPTADHSRRYGHRYTDVTVLDSTNSVNPLAAPRAKIAVADLLP